MTQQTPPKWLIAALSIGALLLVIFYALGMIGGKAKVEPGETAVPKQTLPAQIETIKVGAQQLADKQSWQGTVQSRSVAKLAPRLNARILDVTVQAGDKVKKGDVIARLDDRDLRAAYNAASAALIAAQAQANQAGSEEKRTSDLYDRQAATRQNLEMVQAQAQSARAMVNQAAGTAQQAKVMLGENVLYAPFDGVISQRLQEPGDMASPAQAIVSLYKPADLRLEAAIADHCLANVQLGDSVTVRIDAVNQTLKGKVDEVAPASDPQTHTRLIKVSLPDTNAVQHGQFGWLELGCSGAEQHVMLIPATAVVHYGQLQAVKVVEDGRVQIRHIRVGKTVGEQVQVLSGLHDGDTLIANSGRQP